MTPAISVIIPYYSKFELLHRAVNSIPDIIDIEVIIIDNGEVSINSNSFSSTRTNVNILYSDKLKGAGCARNIGLENCKGKWVIFLDADDFFTEGAFDTFRSFNNTNYDIIYFNTTSCYSDTLEASERHLQYVKYIDDFILNPNNEDNLRYCWKSPWGKMIKRKLIIDNNIQFEEISAGNDILFSVKTGYHAKEIHADTNIVYCVTIEKGSITNRLILANIESRCKATIRYNTFVSSIEKKECRVSIMLVLIQALKFGIKPFGKLVIYSIKNKNNLFIGCSRWLRTLFGILKKRGETKKYLVKE